MFSSKSLIWLVSALALFALFGLLFLQFNWLEGMIRIREEKFRERTKSIMQEVTQLSNQRIGSSINLNDMVYHQDVWERERLGSSIKQLMDSLLHSRGLETDYEFGLHSCRSDDFQYFSDPGQAKVILQGEEKKLEGCLWKTPEGREDHLHLYVVYPQKSAFIIGQLSGAIGSAIVFVLIIGGAFIYTIRTIMRQRKLSEMKNDFVNNLTHEFKTPIASITLAARTLKRLPGVSGSAKARDYIALIDQEGRRLENHVDKVLQMAAIDSGSFALDKKPVDVHDLLRAVLNSLQMQLEQQQVKVRTSFLASASQLRGDSVHLFNVFYNLLDNAIKYCGLGFELTVRTLLENGQLKIEVQDNGPGIPPELHQQVFEQFYRPPSGNLHRTKGFGLGLHYVKRLVEAHGGKVCLDSRPQLGSTFSLIFPIA